MSRSFKKTPVVRDNKNTVAQKHANKTVRRTSVEEKIPDGKSYTKLYNSYNLFDYKIHLERAEKWATKEGVEITEKERREYFSK